MRIDILSLFPEYFNSPFNESIIKRAKNAGYVDIALTDIRDFSDNKFRKVDDRPYGGGPGMVMMPAPVCSAIRTVKTEASKVVYLSPQGKVLDAKKCKELAQEKHLILLCGHYEGIDERALKEVDEEISIGDFVLTNGCLAAIVLVDAVVRHIPGVLGHEEAALQDSFEKTIFDHPHYTRPQEFEGIKVPTVLQLGNHKEIEQWRYAKALEKTACNRFDLFLKHINESISAHNIESEKIFSVELVQNIKKSLSFYLNVLGNTVINRAEASVWIAGDDYDQLFIEAPQFLVPWHIMLMTVNGRAFKLIKLNLEKQKVEYAQLGAYLMFKDPDDRVWCIKDLSVNKEF